MIMNQLLRSLAMVLTTIWVGGLVWVGLVFAPYLFALAGRHSEAVPHSGVAAELIGPLLYGSDLVGLVAVGLIGLILFILRRRKCLSMGGRFYVPETLLGLAALCTALNYFRYSPALNSVQEKLRDAYGGFHLADRSDPLYAEFTSLHQTSTAIFLCGMVVAFVVLICQTNYRDQSSVS